MSHVGTIVRARDSRRPMLLQASVPPPISAGIHSYVIVGVLPLVLIFHAIIQHVDLFDAPLIAALLILMLGVPHGAFDIAIIQHRSIRSHDFELVRVLVAYVGLAALVIAAWLIVPGLCLAIFLTVSAYHFSGDWPVFRVAASRLMVGGALLSATALFHQDEVRDIFSLLALPDAAGWLAGALNTAAVPLIASAIVLTIQAGQKSAIEAIEYSLILASALILPPITFFVIYFCLVHSVRHALAVRRELWKTPVRELVFGASPYAAVAIFGPVAGGILIARNGIGLDMLSMVFIALAALTVPHMALVDRH